MEEGTLFDRKSLKTVVGRTANYDELAKDCVAFANSKGGYMHIGVEDGESLPPLGQQINQQVADKVVRRLNELTINVCVAAEIQTADNGGEYINLKIWSSTTSIASTTKGGYFIRDDDKSRVLLPEELSRLMTDKPSYCWETTVSMKYRLDECDTTKKANIVDALRKSNRVSSFVKEKAADDLMEYYSLVDEKGFLTNLGILWIGTRAQRSKLLYSPVVQYIKYDEDGNKLNKILWDDYSMNPMELLDSIWGSVPEWRDYIEVSEGLWRKPVPCYDEKVVREVLCNAIMHRPYTNRGDVFINMYPDRMEVVNPGLFPMGVTPDNILQKQVKRNEHLSRLCVALHMMEGEGSGYDLMYETLLTSGKSRPIAYEGSDFVKVVIERKVANKEVVQLCDYVISNYHTTQKGRIALGLILNERKLTAARMSKLLQLQTGDKIESYIGKLVDEGIIAYTGRGKGTQYFISPRIIHNSKSNVVTSLKTIEPYRLRALIKEDLRFHPDSLWSEVSSRLPDVDTNELQRTIRKMSSDREIICSASRKYRRYKLP